MADTIVSPSTTTTGTTSTSTNQAQNLLTHIKSMSDAIDKGDVLGSAMGVANVALDVIGVAGDPLGAISSAGVSWVLNAVKFLREPFDILMGNPSAITGSSQSWLTTAQSLTNTAQVYRQASTTQTTSWMGAAATGYRTTSNNQADGLQALAQASQAVSSAMKTAGQAVAQARQVVMNLISQAVQQIIMICIEALSCSWLSFGASIAKGIAQSVQKAVTTATKTMKQVKDVVEKLQKIIKAVQTILQVVQQVKQLLAQIGGKASDQPVVTPQVQPVSYTVQSQGLDPNNMGVFSTPGTPAAPGYHWEEVRNVAENGAQVFQTAPQLSTGPQIQAPPQVNPQQSTQTAPQLSTGPVAQAPPQVNPQATQTNPQATVPGGQIQAPPQVNPAQTPRGTAQQPAAGAQVQQPARTNPTQTGGRVSQNGWPVNPTRSAHTIPGTNIRVTVADGDAGDVLMHVLGQVNSRVEGVDLNGPAGEHDDWGYADRNVRGSQAISNHASATAVDINATRHVLGAQDTFTPAQTTEIHNILGEVDNVVRWGGDYTGRRDEMHFEIIGTQEEVARVAERLRQAQQPPH
jgi:hypothetical protein